MHPRQRNLVVMGYKQVGKTSLCTQFAEEYFPDNYEETIENTFTKFMVIEHKEYLLKLVDTPGQDEYSFFPARYTMDVHVYILVYSVTSRKSFNIVKSIYKKVLDHSFTPNIPVVLVGNKTDLAMDERMISVEEGLELADDWKAVFLETSAKENRVVQYNQGYLGYFGRRMDYLLRIILAKIISIDKVTTKLCTIS